MSRARGLALALACALAVGLPVPEARADDTTLAEALFAEGTKLLQEGKTAEACDAIAKAVDLAGSKAIGGMLVLADCRERQGRPATAWSLYKKAFAVAQREGDPRAADADAQIARLEPMLPRLVVRVAPALAQRAELSITLRGAALPPEAWGLPTPIDPGPVTVTAALPGAPAHTWSLTIDAAALTHEVDVAPWDCSSTPGCVPPPMREAALLAPGAAAPASPLGPLGTAGLVTGGAGLATLTASLGVALHAAARYRDALDDPDNDCAAGRCNERGVQAVDDARGEGDLATGLTVAGAVLAGAGLTLTLVDILTPKAPAAVGVARLSVAAVPLGVVVTAQVW